MRFKQFEIRKPIFLGEPPTEDYYKYNFNVVVHPESDFEEGFLVIATLRWNKGECGFDFESVGTRYLKYREDGLEEWLLAWCEMKSVEYKYEEE